MKAVRSLARLLAKFALLVVFAAVLTRCADPSADPSSPRSSIPLAFSLSFAGNAASAFDKADALDVRLIAGEQTVLDTVVAFASGGADVRLHLRVDPGLEGQSLLLNVELRQGNAPLFTGSATVVPTTGTSAPVDVVLNPVVARIVGPASSPVISSIGGIRKLTAAAVFATGDTVPDIPLIWSLIDRNIVSLNTDGTAQALTEGSARVEARYGNLTATITVVVRIPTVLVVVNPDKATLGLQGTQKFAASAFDANNNLLKNRVPVWGSSNAAVVSIDSTGLARAVAVGTANINATVDGVTGSAQVTVTSVPPPAAPTSLAQTASGTSITLQWTDVATNEASYEVYRGTQGGARARIATLSPNTTSYTDNSQGVDQVLDYSVAACNAAGCVESAVITARTVPKPPLNLTVAALNVVNFSFTLQWVDGSAAETRFQIDTSDSTASTILWNKRGDVAANVTTYDGSSSPADHERLRVLACNDAGCSAPSNIVYVSFPFSAPNAGTLPSLTRTELRGSTDGFGQPHTIWFTWSETDPTLSTDTMATLPFASSSAGIWTEPLYDISPGYPVYYRMNAQNNVGIAHGAVLSFTTPDLSIGGPFSANVCNRDPSGVVGQPQPCPFNPDSVVITIYSAGPINTYQNPFTFVSVDDDTYETALGQAAVVSVFDDPGFNQRFYTFRFVWRLTPSVSPGNHTIVARGYTGSSGGNVIAGSASITVNID